MAINFEEIPSYEDITLNEPPKTRTVLEELNARQHLVEERAIKCGSIRPLYARTKKPPHRYLYQYFCVCPRFKPQYKCKHVGNIIIDRDVLTQEEHIVYLARPKPNFAAPRKMPRYFVKRSIVANCTARVMRLAKPDKKQVTDTLNHFDNIISRRHKRSLQKCLEYSPNVEYTTIKTALELMREEKRLRRVANRNERVRCRRLKRKIVCKQRRQIRKIVWLLFEDMKEFLLNDEFNREQSPLGEVILETIKDFTDKDFHMTNNLRDYQKTLAYNLAIWISKFLSNLNGGGNVTPNAPPPPLDVQPCYSRSTKPKPELSTFLPLQDYVLQKGKNDTISTTKMASNELEAKSEPESETIKDCSAADVSYSNILTDNDRQILKHLTDEDNVVCASTSSSSEEEEENYFSARTLR